MAVGGIPYYLGFFRKGLSLGQNIDQLFFCKKRQTEKRIRQAIRFFVFQANTLQENHQPAIHKALRIYVGRNSQVHRNTKRRRILENTRGTRSQRLHNQICTVWQVET